MDKRTILAIVLAFAVVIVYQFFFVKPVPQQPVPTKKEGQAAGTSVESKPPAFPATAVQAKPHTPPRVTIPAQEISVETPLYSAVFTTRGAALKSFRLKEYRKTLEQDSPLIEMVEVKEGMDLPLAITFPDSSASVSSQEIYRADAGSISLRQAGDVQKLSFSASQPDGMRVEKTFTFYGDRYHFELDVRVYNSSARNLNEKAFLTWNHYVDPKIEEDSYGHLGPVYDIKNEIDTVTVQKMESRKVLGLQVSWGAFESKYFIAAMIPRQPSLTSLVLAKDAGSLVSVSLEGPNNVIPTSQSATYNYSLYIGPKEYKSLQAEGVGLENAIDFGSWIKWLALPLLISLNFLYKFFHNYGVAIIIITIAIKVIFWPLGNKSYKSMKDMQKLQPIINDLKTKYKDDKARLNQEVMQVYKTYKINPLGGCLPMVIQIPVFFGLYKALLYSIELRHQPFVLWIQDLSAKDPYYITPIIMGATMFWQQKMTPAMGDPMQQKLMLLMPVVFTFLFLNFPAGLVIYWLFNNILSIGQQYYINKKVT
jgi:YidC/Oxa1 family membrane protein insertase